MEIPGVATMTFLRTAVNAVRKARGEKELSTPDFLKFVREKAKLLKIDPEMLRRPLNVGFSGGEKKRNEILQMALLEPSLCVLDETDSGLDIDAVRIVAEGVNALRSPDRAMLVITHYQRLLNYIVPDRVHVLSDGRVARSGGPELALELEQTGYAECGGTAAGARPRKGASWTFLSPNSGPRPSRPISTSSSQRRRLCRARPMRGFPSSAARPSRPMASSACRIGASRPGNIPTCAPR
jgi:energy-coupling factor transporter ATP-binding protein EcfA2